MLNSVLGPLAGSRPFSFDCLFAFSERFAILSLCAVAFTA